MIQVLLHCCIYMYITMPLTAILSLHKYDLLALNILHQNCWCKWSKSFDCYLKLIFSQSIDHFLHDRSTRKGMHLRYSYRILKNKQTKKTSWAICTSCSQMSDFISPDPPQVILLFLMGDLKMSVELWRK